MSALPTLTLIDLKREAGDFARELSLHSFPALFGVNDGKTVGTLVEHHFRSLLLERYDFPPGNSASGVDFPHLNLDLKVTSLRQPQSSSPFRSASEKVYGLGYHLLVMVYEKTDEPVSQAAFLNIVQVAFVDAARTGDYQTTFGLLEIIRRNGNSDDIEAFLDERNLPVDEIGRRALAERIFNSPPALGYLTISNALQWRLQYNRVLSTASTSDVDGLENLLD